MSKLYGDHCFSLSCAMKVAFAAFMISTPVNSQDFNGKTKALKSQYSAVVGSNARNGASYTRTRIVDTDTFMPGAMVTFGGFGSFVVEGDDILFTGSRTFQGEPTYAGLYRIRDGLLDTVVDLNFPAPGPDPTFEFISGVSVQNGKYLFGARTSLSENGLFLVGDGQPLALVANSDEARRFTNFSFNENETTTFSGSLTELLNNDGVFLLDGDVVSEIASLSTQIPDGTGNFEAPTFLLDLDNDNGYSVFTGFGSGGQQGIYSNRNGDLEKVFDLTDFVPGTGDTFAGFAYPEISETGDIVFLGGTLASFGFYKIDSDGNFSILVDTDTAYPESNNNFVSFGLSEFDGDRFVFLANDTNQNDPWSLLYSDGSTIEILLRVGEVIDGKKISFIAGPGRFENGVVHVNVRFVDDSIAAYQFDFGSAKPETVVVDSLTVSKGVLRSGDEASLLSSDNQRASISRNSQLISPTIELVVRGVSSNENPSRLSFTLESNVFARSGIVQEIELYNYDTNTFEVVDTRNASRFVDAVHLVEPVGDVSRFIENGTGCLEARVSYTAPINRARFSASIDQANWDLE